MRSVHKSDSSTATDMEQGKATMSIKLNCQLDDLLRTESNPVALDRICEGEKQQTAEFYEQKEKIYKRNLTKLHRKARKGTPQTSTIRQPVLSVDNPPTVHDNPTSNDGGVQPSVRDDQTSALLIATEGVMEPVRSNEAHEPQHDPYQLPTELTQIPVEMPSAALPDDENFGSKDVDGARDFLELCTGEELPPMSIRQTMTRDMLMLQLPSIPVVPPLVDNFQELDFQALNTPMFKRPLETSTPFLTGSVQDVLIPLPALPELGAQEAVNGRSEDPTIEVPQNAMVEMIPATVETMPAAIQSVEMVRTANLEEPVRPVAVQSSSSTDLSDTPATRPRRNRREVSLRECLEPFEPVTPTPRPRRNFDIFSFPCYAIWNKTIQDVQTQLAERYKQLQFREATVMREAAPEQRIDSGFQQTPDQLYLHPTMNTTETSNLVTINQTSDKKQNVQSIQQDTLLSVDLVTSMQPNELVALGSIEGKLLDVSDRYHLKPFTEATFSTHEETATKQLAPVENVPVLQESSGHNVMQPTVEVDSQSPQKRKRGNRNKNTKSDQKENCPIPDVSSVLYDQAKELETVSEQIEAADELLPLDTMVVDILLMVQGAMNDEEQIEHSVSVQRLQQLLRITSCLDASKLFKNIILLKQADLLAIECDSERRITDNAFAVIPVRDRLRLSCARRSAPAGRGPRRRRCSRLPNAEPVCSASSKLSITPSCVWPASILIRSTLRCWRSSISRWARSFASCTRSFFSSSSRNRKLSACACTNASLNFLMSVKNSSIVYLAGSKQ
uniref:Uncharacterized protein n=1 Tax=Anopheles culicifacies TaxID=139723 RepID=A0A182MW84_9DIPT